MKFSRLLLFLIFPVIFVCSYLLYENDIKNAFELMGRDEVLMEDLPSFRRKAEEIRAKNQIKIPVIGGIVVIGLIFLSRLIAQQEDKDNPIKNLENLKNTKIISEEEYESKLNLAKNIELENKQKKELEKFNKKSIEELENLRKKGILSESEFNEKMEYLKNR